MVNECISLIFDSVAYTLASNPSSCPSRWKVRLAPFLTWPAYRSGTANSTFSGDILVNLATMVLGEA